MMALRRRTTAVVPIAIAAFVGAMVAIGAMTDAGAQAAREVAPVTPATITPGRPQSVTITVPGKVKVPTDPKQIVVTVGMVKADVQSVRGQEVTFRSPAFVSGVGEREVAVFSATGELGRGVLQYVNEDQQQQLGIFIVFVLATLPMAMLWYDIHKAYQFAASTRTAIISKTSSDGLTLDELRLVLAELTQAPPGIPGLARTMMAFMLMLIVAGAMFYVLSSGIGEVPAVIDKTMTVITTALTTVIAFYFGARTATTAASAASAQTLTSGGGALVQGSQAPTISAFRPAAGAAGTPIAIAGRGFGTSGTISFGTVAATPTHWSDALIIAPVPAGLAAGQRVAIEIVPQGAVKPISSAPNLFTP